MNAKNIHKHTNKSQTLQTITAMIPIALRIPKTESKTRNMLKENES